MKTRSYVIKQLPILHENLFANWGWQQRHGGWHLEDYEDVYEGEIEVQPKETVQETLERIFEMFNADERPAYYHGRSLSVGDVVEIDGESVWFCDSLGFRNVED